MILDGQRFIKMIVSCYNNLVPYRCCEAHFILFLYCFAGQTNKQKRMKLKSGVSTGLLGEYLKNKKGEKIGLTKKSQTYSAILMI